jgi:hypothetical protein
VLAPEDAETGTKNVAVGGGAVLVIVVSGTSIMATQTSSNAGPILAFIGAVLVSMIAAATAHYRQTAEIHATERRQQRALAAEADRLAQQLEHTRQLDEIAYLRDLVDEAARVYEAADEAIVDLIALADFDESTEAMFDALHAIANKAQIKTAELLRRIELRFPPGEPLTISWNAVRAGFFEAMDEIDGYDNFKARTGDDLFLSLIPAKRAFAEFCEASRERFG